MLGANAKEQLKALVERIERIEEEKAALSADIREIYAEAKSEGFDTKAIREIIRLRRQDEAKRREREAVRDTYLHALGMLADTPLGQAALGQSYGVEANA